MTDKSKPAEAMVEAVRDAMMNSRLKCRGTREEFFEGMARAAIAAHWSALAPVIAEAYVAGCVDAWRRHEGKEAIHKSDEAYAARTLSTLRGETTI